MDQLRIRGGNRLTGNIAIGGAKNAALPLMAACLLTDRRLVLSNMPRLADIESMAELLRELGVTCRELPDRGPGMVMALHQDGDAGTTAPYDLVRKMRASVLVLGPLLARQGVARVSLPGGCAIGNRPVDLHLKGLAAMGAEVEIASGYIQARTAGGRPLRGARVLFPTISVGATENLLMAATLARGESVLVNAAREPEVVDLADCLIAMGARIEGHGTDTIRIQGVEALGGTAHRVIPDRIEAGTYAIAAAITGGDVTLLGARPDQMEATLQALAAAGIGLFPTGDGLRVRGDGGRVGGIDLMTEPFPGFATDLQAQMMVLMAVADGASMITETIFENRFMHVPELVRMGASITVHHASAIVRGVPELAGAPVMATDLRASVSLVLAGLAARGETIVNRLYHLDRGYERLVGKLRDCGAVIERISPERGAQDRVA